MIETCGVALKQKGQTFQKMNIRLLDLSESNPFKQ